MGVRLYGNYSQIVLPEPVAWILIENKGVVPEINSKEKAAELRKSIENEEKMIRDAPKKKVRTHYCNSFFIFTL
jgi:hypothetical protein